MDEMTQWAKHPVGDDEVEIVAYIKDIKKEPSALYPYRPGDAFWVELAEHLNTDYLGSTPFKVILLERAEGGLEVKFDSDAWPSMEDAGFVKEDWNTFQIRPFISEMVPRMSIFEHDATVRRLSCSSSTLLSKTYK